MVETATDTNLAARAQELHASSIVIDGLTYYYDGPSERVNPAKLTAFNATACETANGWTASLQEIMDVRRHIERDPSCVLVRTAADIEQAKQDGKSGLIIGVQASAFVEMDLWRLQLLHDVGLRIFQLTYNDRAYTGDGCLENEDGGLTRFGRSVIDELARLGIALDLSHVGRRTALEAIEASSVPPMFSHANPNAITENPRNLTDEQIRKIGERDGMIGICSWAPLCWKNQPQVPSVDDLVDHVDYVVQMIGAEHVGLATDSGCTTNQAWLDQHSLDFSSTFPEITGDYLANVGGGTHPPELPDLTNLDRTTEALLRRGYSDHDVQGILGGNFLRHFRTVWGG
ncbi:MAG: membrane dipeptidase [Thermomicrobiales bacterium]|nr:membrane dipeptidase [Thermomicrobiales bacterium]